MYASKSSQTGFKSLTYKLKGSESGIRSFKTHNNKVNSNTVFSEPFYSVNVKLYRASNYTQILFLAMPVYFFVEMAGNWWRIKVVVTGKEVRHHKVKIRI